MSKMWDKTCFFYGPCKCGIKPDKYDYNFGMGLVGELTKMYWLVW